MRKLGNEAISKRYFKLFPLWNPTIETLSDAPYQVLVESAILPKLF